LSSNVLHSLNNGRPLEAAAGFDEWRKSVIEGKTYVVDALVRRRTAEKALFLRPVEGVVAAPRNEIPPSSDSNYPRNDADEPAYGRYTDDGIVARAPYEAGLDTAAEFTEENNRRREDGPAGTLTLSEILPDEQTISDVPATMPANEDGLSPIAVAAAEVSERLDALIADRPEAMTLEGEPEEISEKPKEIVIDATNDFVELPFENEGIETAANDGAHEEYRRPGRDRQPAIRTPDVYITKMAVNGDTDETGGIGGFWVALLLGLSLSAGGAYKWLVNPASSADRLNAFLAPVATIIGGMIVFGALYYLIKSAFSKAE